MAKQVQMIDPVNDMLDDLTKQLSKERPHLSVTKQSIVADMIIKAHKRKFKS